MQIGYEQKNKNVLKTVCSIIKMGLTQKCFLLRKN